jgi:hypothetical protein
LSALAQVLALYGVILPETNEEQDAAYSKGRAEVNAKLPTTTEINKLLDFPECTNSIQETIMHLYVIHTFSVFF